MTPGVTKKLFSDIAPKFADRAGGYTRIIPPGIRVGDGAKVAILELVGYEFKKKEKKESPRSKRPWSEELNRNNLGLEKLGRPFEETRTGVLLS